MWLLSWPHFTPFFLLSKGASHKFEVFLIVLFPTDYLINVSGFLLSHRSSIVWYSVLEHSWSQTARLPIPLLQFPVWGLGQHLSGSVLSYGR